jgi:hypothetical protein
MAQTLDLLARGFIIGLSIAIPVGPIGVLCVRRTLAVGLLRGRFDIRWMRAVNMGSGLIIAGFGCLSLAYLWVG